jgi:hypothetical protein
VTALDRGALRDEIARAGFRRDPLAAEHADRRHHGLNIAIAWPWPTALESAYGEFARRLAALHPGLYVYPFATTHVTVLTAVNFKTYPDASDADVRDIDRAADDLGRFLAESTGDLGAFALDTSRAALATAAAFIPMSNPTGEIAKVRERALAFCRAQGGVLAHASAPQAIHSTMLRFREPPADTLAFADAFDEIARELDLGTIVIDRLLVTLETKPYMREGRLARTIELRRP